MPRYYAHSEGLHVVTVRLSVRREMPGGRMLLRNRVKG
jgi:hypothetical protein